MNSSSNDKKKPEKEDEGSLHQATSEKNESSQETAKGRNTVSYIPPVMYASFLNLNFIKSINKTTNDTSAAWYTGSLGNSLISNLGQVNCFMSWWVF